MMNNKLFKFVGATVLLASLAACGQKNSENTSSTSSSASPAQQVSSFEGIKERVKGIQVGAMMSERHAVVFFDPQCNHCGHLWESSKELHSSIKFTWVPVALLNKASFTQGAALLQAADPVKAMNDHEASLLARKGGISADSHVPDNIEDALETNSKLFKALKGQSVPFIVYKNPVTGALSATAGAIPAAELAKLMGVSPSATPAAASSVIDTASPAAAPAGATSDAPAPAQAPAPVVAN